MKVLGSAAARMVCAAALTAALTAACSARSTTGDGIEPTSISDHDLTSATLRLDIETCGGLAHQRATAVVLSSPPPPSWQLDSATREEGHEAERVAATVAHGFLDPDGTLAVDTLTIFDSSGRQLEGRLMYLDPATDVALLAVTTPSAGLTLGQFSEANQAQSSAPGSARFVAYAESAERPTIQALKVIRATTATLDGDGARQALELGAEIESGHSGAPVVDDGGHVIGVVFATSRTDKTGWAIASSEYESAMAQTTQQLELGCP